MSDAVDRPYKIDGYPVSLREVLDQATIISGQTVGSLRRAQLVLEQEGRELTLPKRLKPQYERCTKCRELVTDALNCANCANRSLDPLQRKSDTYFGTKKGLTTLDIQEGNSGTNGDRS